MVAQVRGDRFGQYVLGGGKEKSESDKITAKYILYCVQCAVFNNKLRDIQRNMELQPLLKMFSVATDTKWANLNLTGKYMNQLL